MIRKAEKKDVGSILKLIHELAVYEKEPDAVKTSEEDLLRDGFGDQPFFQSVVYEQDEKVMAFALYFFTWSTWEGRPTLYLEDLYVSEQERGKGLGQKMLRHLGKTAVEKNCARMEWSVLDWNTSAREFYHSLGARHMEGWYPYRIEGEALKTLGEVT